MMLLFKAKNNTIGNYQVLGLLYLMFLPPKDRTHICLKLSAFAFKTKTIQPNEVVEFPVTFYIDPLNR